MHPLGTLEGGLEGYVGVGAPAADYAVQAAVTEFGAPRAGSVLTQADGVMAANEAVVMKAAAMEWLKEERGGTGAIRTGTEGDKVLEPQKTEVLTEGEQQQQWKQLLDGGQGKMSHCVSTKHLVKDLEGDSTQSPGGNTHGTMGRKRR